MPTAPCLLRRQLPRIVFYGCLLLAIALAARFRHELLRAFNARGWQKYRNVSEVIATYRPAVEARFRPLCEQQGIDFPPKELGLLVLKQERQLEVWALDGGKHAFLARYPVLAASGGLGPKRRSGDMQVPEGFYAVEGLNPNSAFHLSIKVGYPSSEDIAHAQVPREKMGGDIFIHGGKASIGCVAIGDPAIEEVFTLAALAGKRRIVISPVDFRRSDALAPAPAEPWIAERYARIKEALTEFHGE
jgi:hypothetical protein